MSSYGEFNPKVTVVRFHSEDCIPDGTCEMNECLYQDETDNEVDLDYPDGPDEEELQRKFDESQDSCVEEHN